MNPLMLRVSSSVMATAAFMLMGVAIVLATPGVSHAIVNPIQLCPAEPVKGACGGDCNTPGDRCQNATITYTNGVKREICTCAP